MSCRVKRISIFLTIYLALFSSCFSQCLNIYTFAGKGSGDRLGWTVSSAGDVNNDGYNDLIIGAPLLLSHSPLESGRVYVYSGQTGDTLYVFDGEYEIDHFGISVSTAGDVNGDGYDDMIIGAWGNDDASEGAGKAYVFSGLDGASLHVFNGESELDNFGVSVSTAGDFDNDGYDDVIIGAHANDGVGGFAGRAYVFSGLSGDTLAIFSGEATSNLFGNAVSTAGDVNNDGYDDIIIGAPLGFGEEQFSGRAYVFSGITGDTLFVFNGEAYGDKFGRSLSSAGDVNNDGFDDIVIAAPGNDGSGYESGRVYVFSGNTGGIIYLFSGESAGDNFGNSVSSAGDMNNDGYDDIIVGAYLNSNLGFHSGRAYVFSGKTGDTLFVFDAEGDNQYFGMSVWAAGDVNHDNYDDVLIGAPYYDGEALDNGRAYVFSGRSCFAIRGDVNGDGIDASILDLESMVDRIFRGGPRPVCYVEADVNSDGSSGNILDLTFLVDWIFRGGVPPGPC